MNPVDPISLKLFVRVVELGTIVGYYTAIGNALNVFEVGLPAGQAPYFS